VEPSVPKEKDNLDKDYGCMLRLEEAGSQVFPNI
jgi:hypothetical protein